MSTPMTKEQRSALMSRIHGKDTGPELTVRRALWKAGFRYRVNVKSLPGTPDIVLPKYRSVIFVNGCFWHAHEGCAKYSLPKTNTGFWADKVLGNRRRDAEVAAHLQGLQWNVITVWECETERGRIEDTMSSLVDKLRRNRFDHLAAQARMREQRAGERQEAAARRKHEKELKKRVESALHIPRRAEALSKDEEQN